MSQGDEEKPGETEVEIHADGACSGNPGPMGYAAILVHLGSGRRREFSEGQEWGTNNRAEVSAAILGLSKLKRTCSVKLHSDSAYLVNGGNGRWKINTNPDLWKELRELISVHRVEFIQVRGHSGQPENERADRLAKKEAGRFGRSRTPR